MASQIEKHYGVPLPMEALWHELERGYGTETMAELRAFHREATRRCARATLLNKMRRIVEG